MQIPHSDFEVTWEIAEAALVALGSSQSEIDKIKASRVVTSFKIFHPPTNNLSWSEELLRKIHRQMRKCSEKEDCLDRIVVLCGPPGIGKSELARSYAATYIEDPIIQNVAWVDAEDLNGMKGSFASIANELKIPTKDKELQEIVAKVYEHFANYIQNGLFIFENSPQMNAEPFGIYEYLPIQESLKRRPLVLLTAQDEDWELENEDNVINLDELLHEELIGC